MRYAATLSSWPSRNGKSATGAVSIRERLEMRYTKVTNAKISPTCTATVKSTVTIVTGKPSYYKRTGGLLVRRADAERYARQIHSAFGIFQDDFNAVLAAFNRMPSKAAVSFLADVFQQIYKEDLLTFLTNGGGILPWDGFSDAQLKQLIAYH